MRLSPSSGTTDGDITMLSLRFKTVIALAVTSLVVGLSQLIGNYDDATMIKKTGSIRRGLQESEAKSALVNAISLMGERHSGTNWIADHLTECFGDELTVKVSYSRFKHWFQYDMTTIEPKSTVVVAMFRDPYDWVEAMHERPHHAHSHMNLSWREFVTKPWRGPRRLNDYHLLQRSGGYEEVNVDMGQSCVANYTWNEVIPCSYGDFTSIDGYARYMYELMHDGSGRAYPSIVDLRREKILNFISMKKMRGVKSFHPTRYEDLYKKGTASLIKMLEDETGKQAKCEPIAGKGAVAHKAVPKAFIRWMNKYVDWETEALIGYSKRTLKS
ncbi:hypothetical protein HJC23_003597 [Cyclotella cryptica]|uniref:Sulfotransferase domain-containing protein n=1 Tax=Cyclotella cryptica TaxID=29204 RepID=A0ABD3QLA2_9STRA|eukprot:CCRYP_004883-RA/>CCRYP_004883-RA protein AED:0.14 eAED:0.14 QI:1292/1/1/1/0.6/0.5/6/168/328